MPPKRIANQEIRQVHHEKNKIEETSSDDDSDIDYSNKEKELLDYVLEIYEKAVLELFNIIASKFTNKMVWVS